MQVKGLVPGAVVLLAAAFLFLRRRKPRGALPVSSPAELPAGTAAAETTSLETQGPVSVDDLETRLAERTAMEQKLEAQMLTSLKLAPVITKTAEVLARHLREKIAKEPDVSAQILRTWIHEEEG